MSGQCGTWPSLVCPHGPLPDGGLCRRPPPLHGARGPCREVLQPCRLWEAHSLSRGASRQPHEQPRPPRPSPRVALAALSPLFRAGAPRHSSLGPEPWPQDVSRRPVRSSPRRLTLPTAGPRLPESHGPSRVSLSPRDRVSTEVAASPRTGTGPRLGPRSSCRLGFESARRRHFRCQFRSDRPGGPACQ